jgi:hypothetical protein
MFNKPVVLVIGAGASCEYNFPLGSALKASIAEKVKFRFERYSSEPSEGDYELLQHIRRHVGNDTNRANDYTRAANTLAAAIESFISIDEALHFVRSSTEAVEVGKMAIVSEILAAERKSSLAISRETGRMTLTDDNSGWIAQLFSMAIAGLEKEQLDTAFNNVTFINFNYDRALEHYLYWALQQRTSASAEQANKIVSGLNMIRPYGSLGPLDWQEPKGTAYGYPHHVDPFSLIEGIRTYTEKAPLHDANKVEGALARARMVIFLGFGFHPQNLELIKLPQPVASALQVLATAVKIHPASLPTITDRIASNLRIHQHSVEMMRMKTTDLLRELRQTILIALE